MKRTLFAICITTVALAVGAIAAEEQHPKAAAAGRGKAAATSARVSGRQHVQAQPRQFSARQNQHVTARATNHRATVNNRTNAQVVNRSNAQVKTNRVTSRERGFRNQATVNNNNTVTRNSTANRRLTREQNVQRQRAVANNNVNRNVTVNRTRNVNRNVRVVNNWRGASFAGPRYTAFRNYHRAWHDRGWWDTHYGTNLTFVFGAPYFWSAGFWYPAWGYNPGYVYPYDGPIYGGRNLTPDQIVASVQTQLSNDGYYDGPIDGALGPQTRQALADFQADNGLAVTSAVDEPTLASLGLT